MEASTKKGLTLAVARKLVAHMVAVERRQSSFLPAGDFKQTAAA